MKAAGAARIGYGTIRPMAQMVISDLALASKARA